VLETFVYLFVAKNNHLFLRSPMRYVRSWVNVLLLSIMAVLIIGRTYYEALALLICVFGRDDCEREERGI